MIRPRKEYGRILGWIQYSSHPIRMSSSTTNSWISGSQASPRHTRSHPNYLITSTLTHRLSTQPKVQAPVEVDPIIALDHANGKATTFLKSAYETRSPTAAPQSADLLLNKLRDRGVQPRIETLFWAVECWSLTKRKGSEVRLEALIQEMRECWKDDQSQQSKEDMESAKKLIQAAMLRLCKAYHSACNAHRAEELLLQLLDATLVA